MIFTVTSASIGFAFVQNVMTEAFYFFLANEVRDIVQGSLFSSLVTSPHASHEEVNLHLRVTVMFRPSNSPSQYSQQGSYKVLNS